MFARLRELFGSFALRAIDRRMTASGRRADTGVLVAPRLMFFLTRRRMALLKDAAQSKVVEDPAKGWSNFCAFLREEEASITELIYAVGYLLRSTLYPAAAFLVALATLLGTIHGVTRL